MLKIVSPRPWCCLILSFVCLALPLQASDMRLLIDVSGSMEQNDPQNLRIPAVNLLLKMAPTEATVGVWTFGHKVNALVPFRPVSERWKVDALAQAKRINSAGLLTNIGGVLETILQGPPAGAALLLTDGMVDISKDPAVNVIERQRIIADILPQLIERGIVVHAVALSDNADMTLLESLARGTGGILEVARSPADLTRIFVRLFDDAIEQDRVPIEGNIFLVDSSVEEFTLLVFRDADEGVIQLRGPDQQFYLGGDHPAFIRWYQDQGYELITVKAPTEGRWELFATADAENRVTVISDLQLKVSNLRNTLYLGDAPQISVELLQAERRIEDPAFLDLVDVQLIVTGPDNIRHAKRLEVHEAGVFTAILDIFDELGRYRVKISIDGKTFRREFVQTLDLRALPTLVLEADTEAADSGLVNVFDDDLAEALNDDAADGLNDDAAEARNDDVAEALNDDAEEALNDDPAEASQQALDLQRYGLYALLVLGSILAIGLGIVFYRSRQRLLQQAPDEDLPASPASSPPMSEPEEKTPKAEPATEALMGVAEPEDAQGAETVPTKATLAEDGPVVDPDAEDISAEDALAEASLADDGSKEVDPVDDQIAADAPLDKAPAKNTADLTDADLTDADLAAVDGLPTIPPEDEALDEEARDIQRLDAKVAEVLSDDKPLPKDA